MKKNCRAPFKLKPAVKDYLWGGNKLNLLFDKNVNLEPLAETWECSTNPDGTSLIVSGEWKGRTLSEVIKKHPEIVGKHILDDQIPILVKLIDAKEKLSIQVHPSDEYAKKFENGGLGKTEMWYVLDADDDAYLIYGFKTNVTKKIIKKAIADGTLETYLNKVRVKSGDVFYIEAGIVHAIGAGILVAEIQENSNLTYRLYDYNRVDKNGNLRELHVNKALDVMNMNSVSKIKKPMHTYRFKKGIVEELLYKCKYFDVNKYRIDEKELNFERIGDSFKVLLFIEGQAEIVCIDENLNVHKGECVFIPANAEKISIKGKVTFLLISC